MSEGFFICSQGENRKCVFDPRQLKDVNFLRRFFIFFKFPILNSEACQIFKELPDWLMLFMQKSTKFQLLKENQWRRRREVKQPACVQLRPLDCWFSSASLMERLRGSVRNTRRCPQTPNLPFLWLQTTNPPSAGSSRCGCSPFNCPRLSASAVSRRALIAGCFLSSRHTGRVCASHTAVLIYVASSRLCLELRPG